MSSLIRREVRKFFTPYTYSRADNFSTIFLLTYPHREHISRTWQSMKMAPVCVYQTAIFRRQCPLITFAAWVVDSEM